MKILEKVLCVSILLIWTITMVSCKQSSNTGFGEKTLEAVTQENDNAADLAQTADGTYITGENDSTPVNGLDDDSEACDKAEALLEDMTLDEKVGQLFFVRCPKNEAVEDILGYHLGGYILFKRDFEDKLREDIVNEIYSFQSASKIPMLIGVDEEGGSVVRISSNTNLRKEKFKSPQELYSAGGLDAILNDTKEKDMFLKDLGINVNFAPVADVSTNRYDFIYSRSFGKDGQSTAEYVETVARQMHMDSMGSVLKHFPGYGNNIDTHTGIAYDERPIETFESSDLIPFQSGIDSGGDTCAILVSHNIIACMDKELPASLSGAVHELIRSVMGFDGVVMTDDLAMDAVSAYAENGDVAVMALLAGNDIVLTTDYRTQIPSVIKAVQNGRIKEEAINAAVMRVLNWKLNLGIIQ